MLQISDMTQGTANFNLSHPRIFADLAPVFSAVAEGQCVALLPETFAPSALLDPDPVLGPQVGVTSSGSTGSPKLSWRTWTELTSNTRTLGESVSLKWASPYRPETFAGCQLALQAWVNGTIAVSLSLTPNEAWRQLLSHDITAVSCTPTYLYLLFLYPQAKNWEPIQITLGGEPLTTAQGQLFAARFPKTRFTVIYASAEHGVLLKTSRIDGWFESSFLTEHREWKLVQGELHLHTAGGWIATKDRVEEEGSLLRVVGRADAVANIAGQKYSLALISAAAEKCRSVLSARAGTEPNPITGEIITLNLTFHPEIRGQQQLAALAAVQEALRAQLPKPAWPRRWIVAPPVLGQNSKEFSPCATPS